MVDSNLPPDIPALLQRIEEIRPLIEKNAAEGEENRRVSQESIDALESIGASLSLPGMAATRGTHAPRSTWVRPSAEATGERRGLSL